jgi:hypothetical protein
MDKASCHERAFFLNSLAAMLDGETEYIFIPTYAGLKSSKAYISKIGTIGSSSVKKRSPKAII